MGLEIGVGRRPCNERFTAITRLPHHLTTSKTTAAVTYDIAFTKEQGKQKSLHNLVWSAPQLMER
jgi:hypothetical protein